jgi:ribosomal protein S18 acetylase RimI-like enzyme
MIHCDDWRLSDAAEIEPLLALERAAWLRDLDWDVRAAWHAVEPARRAGTLSGFVARDGHGRVCGWTSFLLHRDNVQVLAFVAESPLVTERLVDAVLESDDSAAAERLLFCVRAAADGLPETLVARGFRVEPYRYLSVDLTDRPPVPRGVRRWAGDGERLARLFARAYDSDTTTRAFAPNGTRDEWTEYVVTLLTTTGCGRFVPELSFVAAAANASELAGAVVVTNLAPGTSHVAQIAVDPGERGRGLGQQLLAGAMSAGVAAGYTRMTLLVAASNRAASSLYQRAGFTDRAVFIVAMADRVARDRGAPLRPQVSSTAE